MKRDLRLIKENCVGFIILSLILIFSGICIFIAPEFLNDRDKAITLFLATFVALITYVKYIESNDKNSQRNSISVAFVGPKEQDDKKKTEEKHDRDIVLFNNSISPIFEVEIYVEYFSNPNQHYVQMVDIVPPGTYQTQINPKSSDGILEGVNIDDITAINSDNNVSLRVTFRDINMVKWEFVRNNTSKTNNTYKKLRK